MALHEDLRLPAARAGRAGGARVRRHRHARGRVPQRGEDRRGRQHAHPARVRRDGQGARGRGEYGSGADPSGGPRGARQDPRRARLDDGRWREPRVLPQGAAHVRLGHHAAHAVQRHLARRASRGATEVPHRLSRVDRAGDWREASLGGRPRAHAHHHAVLRVLQGQGAGHALAQRQGAFEGGAVPRADVQAAGRLDRRRLLVAARHGRAGALRREDRADIRRREGARGGRAQDRHPPVCVRVRRRQAAGTSRQVPLPRQRRADLHPRRGLGTARSDPEPPGVALREGAADDGRPQLQPRARVGRRRVRAGRCPSCCACATVRR